MTQAVPTRPLRLPVLACLLGSLLSPASAQAQFEEQEAEQALMRRGSLLRQTVVEIHVLDADGHASSGTGFFISGDGLVVTNEHVIAGAEEVSVRTSAGATLKVPGWVARDESRDIAILQVEGDGYRYLELGESLSAQAGQGVWTMGHPSGLAFTLERGHLSTIHENGLSDNESKHESAKQRLLQMSLPTTGGSSGSPVIDRSDRVIGVHSSSMGLANLAFAVPVEAVKELVDGRAGQPKSFARPEILWLKLGLSALVFGAIVLLLRYLDRKDRHIRRY